MLQKLSDLWGEDKFFITATANAPYSGCFHEPQIWLVTPKRSRIVWPLYASINLDITNLSELIDWVKRSEALGIFEAFEAHSWGPISDLSLEEHYWGQAVKNAWVKHGFNIPWQCTECMEECEGKDEIPHFISYQGDGGIGVILEGGLCNSCFDRGCCYACGYICNYDYEIYDEEVAKFGLSLCGDHTVRMLSGTIRGDKYTIERLKEAKIIDIVDDSVVLIDGKNIDGLFEVDMDTLKKRCRPLMIEPSYCLRLLAKHVAAAIESEEQ